MVRLTPVKAIRAKCLECSRGSTNEIKICPIEDCALYYYRFGKVPHRSGRVVAPDTTGLQKYRLRLKEKGK
jgi:hypothetical protein